MAGGFSTETHSLTSNFSSAGEIIHAKEKRDFKTAWAKTGLQFGGNSESDPFCGPRARKLLK